MIGDPLATCGYAFNSSRMAFIGALADEDFQLEIDILEEYEKIGDL